MKKKRVFNAPGLIYNLGRKFGLKMKLTLFLFLAGIFCLSASESYSQLAKLSISMKNVSVEQVLSEIEGNSEFNFVYNRDVIDLERKVNVHFRDAKVNDILNELFRNTNVNYRIIDRTIVLSTVSEEAFTEQVPKVTGRVTDVSGNPLPGVSVVLKRTTTGTVTDVDGRFSLVNLPDNAILVFSFVGMKTQEIPVEGKTDINITMIEESIGIEEVVAVGYGTARRKDLTGSVASVSGNALKDIPVASASQAIVGRMAGVQVTKTEGSPDAEIKIRVRGGGSITQDNSPLYIVDGFPVDNINDIAPTDIESIDVLKDASSTAIYGARGANGVILITTKGGFEGKGKVAYNNYFGIKNITKTLDVLDPYEFVYWQYELQNPGYTLTSDIERYYGDFKDYGLYKQMKGTDWQDEVFGRTGTSMYHNLALSGGTKTSKYNISLTRNDEKEIMLGSGYTRTNLTVNTTQKVNKWLSVDLNARLSDYRLKGAGTSNNSRLYHAIQYRPVNGLANFIDTSVDAGDYSIVSFLAYDPVKQTNDDYRRSNQANFNFNGALAASLNKFIQYRLEFGGQYYFNNNDQFFGKNTTNTYSYGEQPLSYITKSDVNSYRLANILTFRKDIRSGHNINIMVGEELNYYKSKSITSSAKYFPDYIDPVSALSMMQLGVADPITTYVNPDVKTSSYFGRINYNYKERYLVSLTSRADGSSKFAPGNRWGFFPSAAFAWRISNENFISFAKDWLSDLKMRVSYGESGNNRISDNAWQKTFSVSTGALYMNGDGENAIPTKLLVPNSILSNPGLKWETTVTNNIGLDFGFLNQRITGSAEVYKNITKDLLVRATIPSSTGYTTQWQNIGQTSNKGLEIVLNGVMVDRKDFRLSASFNIGFNRNRIDNLGDVKRWEQTSGWVFTGGPTGDYLIQEGGSVGQMYGYVTEGMYSVDDFNFTNGAYSLKEGVASDAALIQARRFWPGALKLKDQNGDLIVNAADRVVIGNANPKHTGGFNLMAKFKGFDFSAFFNWVYGNNIYNAMKLYSSTCPSGYTGRSMLNVMNSNNRFIYIDKVSGEIVSDPVKLAEMNKNATIWSAAMNTITLHSWGIEDGSFLRLNTLTLGYSLPKQLLKNVGISQLRIYATGYNLWLWTNYSGFDPEVDTQRSTPLTPGIDWCAYPRSRSFNIGLNVEL